MSGGGGGDGGERGKELLRVEYAAEEAANECEGEREGLNGHQGTRCHGAAMYFVRTRSHFALSRLHEALLFPVPCIRRLKHQMDPQQIIVHMKRWEEERFIWREWQCIHETLSPLSSSLSLSLHNGSRDKDLFT